MRHRFIPAAEGLPVRLAPTDFTPLPPGPSCETTPPAPAPAPVTTYTVSGVVSSIVIGVQLLGLSS